MPKRTNVCFFGCIRGINRRGADAEKSTQLTHKRMRSSRLLLRKNDPVAYSVGRIFLISWLCREATLTRSLALGRRCDDAVSSN